MTLYDKKRAFQDLLRPCCNALAGAGVTANQVTVFAVVLSIAAGGALALYPGSPVAAFLVPAVLLVRMALNAIDGMLAREHGQQSSLGGVLNELGDVVSDAALYLPFAMIAGISAKLVVAVVLAAALTEMAGVVAVTIGAERRYDGPLGKSDRAFVFGLLALVIGAGVNPAGWANVVLALVLVLSIATVVKRTRNAIAQAGP